MKSFPLAVLIALGLPMAAASAHDLEFYIGTYTSPGGSQGIYRASLNTHSGKITKPELQAEIPNPTYLALAPGGGFLYATHEVDGGKVSAFAIPAGEKPRLLNTENAHGDITCHLAVDPAGKNLLVANYGNGSFASLPIRADGSLAPASAVVQDQGHGPNKGRQNGPHAHGIYPDAQGKFAYACDLGTDSVLTFRLDPAAGTLKANDPPAAKSAPGSGPRHLAIHPNGRLAFVNNELACTVNAFKLDPEAGTLAETQTISTLPPGRSPTPRDTTAEMFCHPNGKWLYVSNRGHDSIAAYAIGADGQLSLLEVKPAGVAEPRGFAIDPSGRWLVVAGQNSNNLTALAIDPSTGRLEAGRETVAVGSPACILFAKP